MPSTVAAVEAAAVAAIDCSMTAVARSTTSQVPTAQYLFCVCVPDTSHVYQGCPNQVSFPPILSQIRHLGLPKC